MLMCDLGLYDVKLSSVLNSNGKTQFFPLVQGGGRRPNDALVVITLEALTNIRCLTGKPSWPQAGLVGTIITRTTCEMMWMVTGIILVTGNPSRFLNERHSLSYTELTYRLDF